MAKGKGKACGSGPRGGTRKIAQVRNNSPKFKPSKPPPPASMASSVGKAGIREETGGASGGGGSTKKSKKARPSDAGHAPSAGLAANKAGAAQQPVSSGEDLFKMTSTCVHLVNHPGRDGLLRKLVDIRNEVNTALAMKERSSAGVFGALEGEGMGRVHPQCQDCKEHSLDELDNLLTCLECGYTGCGNSFNRHMLRHCLMQPGDGHCFAVSRTRAEVFCARCCDYVYDVEFDAAVSRADEEFELPVIWNSGFGGDECFRGRRRRRARKDGYYVVTDRFGQQPGRERSWPRPVLLPPEKGRLVAAGVRGMFNLGNTCFMSSVLQAVLHISVMQSFFSEKGHEPAKCEKLRKETTRLKSQILQYDPKASFDMLGGGRGGEGSKGVSGPDGGGKLNGAKKLGDYCIACELARLFEDMYSAEASAATMEDAEPYVPNRLLEAVWSASEFLAGYEQQDAHEFLIAVLDNLHGHLDRAAKNEFIAPMLRRTLAAHKHRAKQQQLQQQLRGGGESISPVAAAAVTPKSKAKKRKQGQTIGDSEALLGWESTTLLESPASAKKANENGVGSDSKNKRMVLSPLAQRAKTMDSHEDKLGSTKLGEFQSNGGSIATPVCPLTPALFPPQGFVKGGKALSNASSRDKALRGGSDTRVAEGGADRSVERKEEGAARSVHNGQCLEDLNLSGFVQEVFAGVTRSDVVCTACGDVSCTYERFLEVSLPVRPEELEKRQQDDDLDNLHQQRQDKPVILPDRSAVGSSIAKGSTALHNGGGRSSGEGDFSIANGALSHAESRRVSPESCKVGGARPSSKEESRVQGWGRSGGVFKRSLGRKGFGGKSGSAGVSSTPRSINDCFARFAAREDLTARMACDSCLASSVFKTKQMSFCSLPRVLVLHLKRFDAMADRKIDDFVSFPAKGLDMGKYLTGWPASPSSSSSAREDRRNEAIGASWTDSAVPPPSLLYDLVAVVNHSGSMAQGHYTAFAKELGRWFEFDDTWVSEVKEEEVLASEAYILIYFQRGADTTWRSKPVASTSTLSDAATPTSPSRSIGARVLPTSPTKNKRL